MIAVRYRILLHEPLLMTHLEGDPNSKVSLPYLPGSALRGAVAAAYAAATGCADLAGDTRAQRLFFSGRTRFLNGYPVAAKRPNERCLPTPRSWRIAKGNEAPNQDKLYAPIYDLAAIDYAVEMPKQDDKEDDKKDDKTDWKTVRKPFHTPRPQEGGAVYLVQPAERMNIHTTRNRRMGRATEADGQVFRYQALAEGQSFEAVVLCDDAGDAQEITRRLPSITALGGARNAGYGRVEILLQEANTDALWREHDLPALTRGDERLIVTLLSDALLRDDHGQAAVRLDLMASAIRRVIPDAVPVAEAVQGRPQKRAFIEADLCGGFNRRWGLPLAQAPTFAMGSVFLFETQAWTAEQVAQLEQEGIGERRAEGFGRLGITSGVEPVLRFCRASDPLAQVPALPLSSGSRPMARRMADRLMQERLERQILIKAANYNIRGRNLDTSPIKPTQIARLRAVLRDELLKDRSQMSLAPVTAHLNGLRSHAETQYRRALVDHTPLNQWIRDVCADATTTFISGMLGFTAQQEVSLGGERSALLRPAGGLTEPAAIECALRFLDAVLARAAKESGNE